MKKVMIVDDNSLAAEGIEKNIDWQSLDAEVSIIEYNSRSRFGSSEKNCRGSDHFRHRKCRIWTGFPCANWPCP